MTRAKKSAGHLLLNLDVKFLLGVHYAEDPPPPRFFQIPRSDPPPPPSPALLAIANESRLDSGPRARNGLINFRIIPAAGFRLLAVQRRLQLINIEHNFLSEAKCNALNYKSKRAREPASVFAGRFYRSAVQLAAHSCYAKRVVSVLLSSILHLQRK